MSDKGTAKSVDERSVQAMERIAETLERIAAMLAEILACAKSEIGGSESSTP